MVVRFEYIKMNVLFIFILLRCFALADSQTGKDDCSLFQLPENVTITEQDGKDTVVFNMTYCGTTTWSMTVVAPSRVTDDYFSWDLTNGEYILKINQTINLEYFYELYKKTIMDVELQFSPNKGSAVPQHLVIHVIPVNEFPPSFLNTPFRVDVEEGTEINSTIFSLINKYKDRDVRDNITKIDTMPAGIPSFDGAAFFRLVDNSIQVTTNLDYETLPERQKFFDLGLVIYDTGGRTGTTEVKIHVIDVDEPPVFVRYECQRHVINKQYPWKIPRCLVPDYVVYVQPNGAVTTIPENITAIDHDIVDNKMEYSFPEGNVETFTNMSCRLTFVNASREMSVFCNTSLNDTEDFDQFYREYEGVDFNTTIQATEISQGRLNTTTPATIHFGRPPFIATTSTTVTITTTVPIKSTPPPVAITTGYKSTTVSGTGESKSDSKTDTTRLLIIVIPSVVGGLLVIIIIIVLCRVCGGCAKDEEREYHLEQKKLAKRKQYYEAYDNVGSKEDANGFGDVKGTTIVHENEVYINAIEAEPENESTKEGKA